MKVMRISAVAAVSFLACLVLSLSAPSRVFAHCDTLDGPVVKDARAALQKGDVTPVLKWVKKENEGEIRAAFAQTLAVRKQGTAAEHAH